MTHPSVTHFTFEFSKGLYKKGSRWVNLTLKCQCTRDRGVIDVLLSHNNLYIPWEFISIVDPELCEEIKTAAAQHYEGLSETVDNELEINSHE
jgi:hypothetical protein